MTDSINNLCCLCYLAHYFCVVELPFIWLCRRSISAWCWSTQWLVAALVFFHFLWRWSVFETPVSLLSQFDCVWENQPTGLEATFHSLPMSLQMFPSFSSQFWYWLIFQTQVLQKKKTTTFKSPQRKLRIYSEGGGPLCAAVPTALSVPQSFTFGQDRECIVPRHFAREVALDEFPPLAVVSSRSHVSQVSCLVASDSLCTWR